MLTAAGVWSPSHARQILGARLERDYVQSELLGVMPVATAAAEVMASPEQIRYAYAGGVAACASLDAWLARHSEIERPLDGVLRHLYDHRDGTPFSRDDLEEAVRVVTGVDCADWLDSHVYGKTALPVPEQLI
jgi:predicted metalloprotease with PDZ domain